MTTAFGRRFSSISAAVVITALMLIPDAGASAEASFTACGPDAERLYKLDAAVRPLGLDNGITLYLLPRADSQTITLASRFEVGSRHEQRGETGWAHLFEHLLFKGSALAPGDNYSQLMNAMGGSFNATTSFDDTRYYSRFPAEGLEFVLALERDRFERPELSTESLANQQKTVLAEMAQTIDNQPYFRAAMEYLLKQAKDTPYQHAIIGSREDIEAATPTSLMAFHRRHYQPSNLTMALVGKMDTGQLEIGKPAAGTQETSIENKSVDTAPDTAELVKRYFGNWQGNGHSIGHSIGHDSWNGSEPQLPHAAPPVGTPVPYSPEQGGSPEEAFSPVKASHGSISDSRAPWPGLLLAWHTVGKTHPDAAAIRLLELHLFQRIASGLERAGISGDQTLLTQSLPLDMAQHGMTNLVLVPRARVSLNTLADGINGLIDDAAQQRLGDEALCQLKALWLNRYLEELDDDGYAAQHLSAIAPLDASAPFAAPWQRINAVTAADLNRVAARYFEGKTVRLDLLPAWYSSAAKGLLEWLPAGWADGLEELAL
ncbi:insulinase family protein [Shewanella sp. JM162201]|uniref:Insulinase family protein n=1 Tax=Shewanella jiangmenensis TaxID=2837387 RepID=A0ABS5V3G2_9GAMM|nr:pitrilysin family protein [Shewanella jiangmenensis]MBT1444356.1 insulinase family protein [Shewanella jiangmenensis]